MKKNNPKKLIKLSTVGMDEQTWREKRLEGIGGSYAGVILGENKWMRPLELFHLYLGDIPQQQEQSEAAFPDARGVSQCRGWRGSYR